MAFPKTSPTTDGNATATMQAACAGAGILLNGLGNDAQTALAVANILQAKPAFDYLEGTWTPVLTSAGTVPTFTTASGTYTRIGRLVFFNAYLNNTSGGTAGSGSNQLSVSLPIATSSAQLPIRIPVGTSQNGADEHMIYATITPSATTALLWRLEESGNNPLLIALDAVDFNDVNTRQLTLTAKLLT